MEGLTMFNIKEYLENNYTDSDVEMLFDDYKDSSSYICDAISERADSLIDIYNYDLIEWAKSHIAEIDEAAEELGKPDSFIGYIQQGQFLYYERLFYDNLEEGIKYAVYSILLENGIEELTDEKSEEVDNFINELDNNSQFNELSEVLEIVKNREFKGGYNGKNN